MSADSPLREWVERYFERLDLVRATNDPDEQAAYGPGVELAEAEIRDILAATPPVTASLVGADLDVERLGKAMWEAWPKHFQAWAGSPVWTSDPTNLSDDLRDAIAAEYRLLATGSEAAPEDPNA